MREKGHQLFTLPDKASDRGRREEGRKGRRGKEEESKRESDREVYGV